MFRFLDNWISIYTVYIGIKYVGIVFLIVGMLMTGICNEPDGNIIGPSFIVSGLGSIFLSPCFIVSGTGLIILINNILYTNECDHNPCTTICYDTYSEDRTLYSFISIIYTSVGICLTYCGLLFLCISPDQMQQYLFAIHKRLIGFACLQSSPKSVPAWKYIYIPYVNINNSSNNFTQAGGMQNLSSPEKPRMTGYLWKRSKVLRNPTRYFFVLYDDKLEYYYVNLLRNVNGKTGEEILKEIKQWGGKPEAVLLIQHKSTIYQLKGNINQFILVTDEKHDLISSAFGGEDLNWALIAPDEDTLAQWIKALLDLDLDIDLDDSSSNDNQGCAELGIKNCFVLLLYSSNDNQGCAEVGIKNCFVLLLFSAFFGLALGLAFFRFVLLFPCEDIPRYYKSIAPVYQDTQATSTQASSSNKNSNNSNDVTHKGMMITIFYIFLTSIDFLTDCFFISQVFASMNQLHESSDSSDYKLQGKIELQRIVFGLGLSFLLLPIYMNYVSLRALGDFKLYFSNPIYVIYDKLLKIYDFKGKFEENYLSLTDFIMRMLIYNLEFSRNSICVLGFIVVIPLSIEVLPIYVPSNPIKQFLLPDILFLSKYLQFEFSDTKAGYIEHNFLRSFKDWWFWNCKNDIDDDSKILQAMFFFLYPVHVLLCVVAWVLALVVSIGVLLAHHVIVVVPAALLITVCGSIKLVLSLAMLTAILSIFSFGMITLVIIGLVYLFYCSIVALSSATALLVSDGFIIAACLTNSELLYEFYGRPEYQFSITIAGVLFEDIPQLFLQMAYALLMQYEYNSSMSGLQIASFAITIWHLSFSFILKMMTRDRPKEKWIPKAFGIIEQVAGLASSVP
jgi:hypothetical protein